MNLNGNISGFGIMLLLSLFFFCTCQKKDITPLPSGAILFYIMADNDLSYFANGDLAEIEQAVYNSTDADCRTFVYVDQLNNTPKLVEFIQTKNGTKKVLIEDYNEQNSCDPAVMHHVLSEVFQSTVTGRRGIIFWSHGTGWFPSSIPFTRSIGVDTEIGTSTEPTMLDIPQLSEVLSLFPPFDFIAFDACFMGSIEVAYELRNQCRIVIASPAEMMADGFDYIKGYKYLVTAGYSPAKFIETTYRYYLSSEIPYAALSVIQTEALEELAIAYSHLLIQYGQKEQNGIPHFDRNSTNYFYDFAFTIRSYPENKYRSNTLQVFHKAVSDEFHTPLLIDTDISQTSGLSIYLPSPWTGKVDTKYEKLAWYKTVKSKYSDF